MKLRWSSKAQSDLDDIRDHTRRQWGSPQAAIYLRIIRAAIRTASSGPLQAATADHYRAGHRKIVAGAHVVFFRIKEESIEIVRILHGAMDIDSHLQ